MPKSKLGKGNTVTLGTAVSGETAVRFRDMCDRKGISQSALIRELIEGAVAADKFVFIAIGDYNGDFVVDIDLPDVEAGKMQLQCAMKARLNELKEQANANRS